MDYPNQTPFLAVVLELRSGVPFVLKTRYYFQNHGQFESRRCQLAFGQILSDTDPSRNDSQGWGLIYVGGLDDRDPYFRSRLQVKPSHSVIIDCTGKQENVDGLSATIVVP